jgi:hypothetical protein
MADDEMKSPRSSKFGQTAKTGRKILKFSKQKLAAGLRRASIGHALTATATTMSSVMAKAQNGLAAAMTLGFDDQETHAGRYEVAILLNAMPPEQLDLGTLHKGRSSRVSPISERETILKDCAEVVQAIKKEIQGDMLVRRVQRGQEEKILILISPSELWLADTRNKLKFERWLRAGGVGDVSMESTESASLYTPADRLECVSVVSMVV